MSDNIFYPFGYGLSYGNISYSEPSAVKNKDNSTAIKVKVSNSSNVTTVETVQVYVSAPGAGQTAPIQQLAAFKRVEVKPNSSVDVSFTIPVERVKTVEEDGSLKLRKGTYKFTIGGAAPSKRTSQLGVGMVEKEVKF